MNESRFAWKVGLFVFVSLTLGALLILNFSKGLLVFQHTYRLHITMPTVAGLKPAADVMMAGVTVGKVVSTELQPDGRAVDITVEILSKYPIRKGADFHIDALGFLGDQYIEVTPPSQPPTPEQPAVFLTNGTSVTGEAPFNLQEAVRSISGLVDQGQKTMRDMDRAISNINNSILAENTLSNFVGIMTNIQSLTADASSMSREVRGIIDTNGPSVTVTMSNVVALTQKLHRITDNLDVVISNNSGNATSAISNINAASFSLQQVAQGLEAGQGLAGGLLKDEKMKVDFTTMLTNISDMTDEFARFGQSLNQNGLWHMLWKPKSTPTNKPAR